MQKKPSFLTPHSFLSLLVVEQNFPDTMYYLLLLLPYFANFSQLMPFDCWCSPDSPKPFLLKPLTISTVAEPSGFLLVHIWLDSEVAVDRAGITSFLKHCLLPPLTPLWLVSLLSQRLLLLTLLCWHLLLLEVQHAGRIIPGSDSVPLLFLITSFSL